MISVKDVAARAEAYAKAWGSSDPDGSATIFVMRVPERSFELDFGRGAS
jgi:hypothetical protein